MADKKNNKAKKRPILKSENESSSFYYEKWVEKEDEKKAEKGEPIKIENPEFINISYITSSKECELIYSISELDKHLEKKAGGKNAFDFEGRIINKFFNKYGDSDTLFLKNKYLYIFTEGAINYLESVNSMIADKEAYDKIEIPRLQSFIAKLVKMTNPIDIVSIGSADFAKETIGMYSQRKNIATFYPIDVGPTLLQLGIQRFKQRFNSTKNCMEIELSPILGDLWDISDMAMDESKRKEIPFLSDSYDDDNNLKSIENRKTKLFTFLGSTLGNYHEYSIIAKISDLMLEGDYLFIGFEIYNEEFPEKAQKELNEKYSTTENARFILDPIYHIPKYRGFLDRPHKYLKLKDSVITEITEENTDYKYLTDIPDAICLAPSLYIPDGDNGTKKITLVQSTKYKYTELDSWVRDNFDEFEIYKMYPEDKKNRVWHINIPDDKHLGFGIIILKKKAQVEKVKDKTSRRAN